MKKLLLFCALLAGVAAVNAQTHTTSKKAHKTSKSALANAKFQKEQTAKSLSRKAQLDSLMASDSMRLAGDSLSDLQKDSLRLAYRTAGLRAIDSLNAIQYKTLIAQNNSNNISDRTQYNAARAAGLNDYQYGQVKVINDTYNEKANALLQSAGAAQQQQQLSALNEERREKIRAVVGKGKEKRLERDRKAYIAKNGTDPSSQWVDLAESYSKK